MPDDLLSTLARFIADTVETFGYVGVALLVTLETVFPPIPSEAILPVAGFLIAEGRFVAWGVVLAATVGSVLGATLLYLVGHWLGGPRIRGLICRHGRWLLLDEADYDRAQQWFNHYGGPAVFTGRLLPLVRSLISIPAGVCLMPLGRFIAYTAAGSALWNGLLIGGGWLFGEQWDRLEPYSKLLEYLVLLLFAASLVVFIWRRRERLLRWLPRRGSEA